MKIDLKELLRRVGNEADLTEEVQVSFPADGLVLTKPVRVDLHLLNTGTSVLLSGTLETEAELECARCLKKFRRPVSARLSEEYVREVPAAPAKKGREIELKAEDFVYPLGPDETLDLNEMIRQNLVLALPIKVLCRETCEGV
ncbi:MAG: DUF177 domain-containing protein [Candidatus Saganbacteria bacterium]|nr:DUF177 domain-containing protein [Candidatus Saganbacteria bacterium]